VQVLARVAAIEVAKASGRSAPGCRTQTLLGRRVTKVWSVSATTNAVSQK
jgi:hypothetical protein